MASEKSEVYSQQAEMKSSEILDAPCSSKPNNIDLTVPLHIKTNALPDDTLNLQPSDDLDVECKVVKEIEKIEEDIASDTSQVISQKEYCEINKFTNYTETEEQKKRKGGKVKVTASRSNQAVASNVKNYEPVAGSSKSIKYDLDEPVAKVRKVVKEIEKIEKDIASDKNQVVSQKEYCEINKFTNDTEHEEKKKRKCRKVKVTASRSNQAVASNVKNYEPVAGSSKYCEINKFNNDTETEEKKKRKGRKNRKVKVTASRSNQAVASNVKNYEPVAGSSKSIKYYLDEPVAGSSKSIKYDLHEPVAGSSKSIKCDLDEPVAGPSKSMKYDFYEPIAGSSKSIEYDFDEPIAGSSKSQEYDLDLNLDENIEEVRPSKYISDLMLEFERQGGNKKGSKRKRTSQDNKKPKKSDDPSLSEEARLEFLDCFKKVKKGLVQLYAAVITVDEIKSQIFAFLNERKEEQTINQAATNPTTKPSHTVTQIELDSNMSTEKSDS